MNINHKLQRANGFPVWLLTNFLLLLLVLVVLKQASPIDTRLERDSGIYMYVSNTLLKGEIPYINAWESKPPGIFFVNALGLWVGTETRWGIWLVEFLFLFLSIQLSFQLLKRQFGLFTALVSSAIGLWGLNRVLAGGNFTEEYSLLFSFASLWLWLTVDNKKHLVDIGIGFCIGCAILLRPNNIGVQVAIGITLFLQMLINKEFKALLIRYMIMVIFAFIPVFVSGLFFASQNAFDAFIEASLLYNLFYTGGNLDLKESLVQGLAHLGGAGGFFLIGYFFAVYQLIFKKQQSSLNVIVIWIIVNGALEVFLSGVSGKAFEHYFICWIPNIVLSTAYLVAHLFPEISETFTKYSIRYSLVTLFIGLILFLDTPPYYANSFNQILSQREKGFQYIDPVAAYVNINTEPEDLVLVWGGQAGINFLSQRDSSTPYIFYPLFEPSPYTDVFSLEYYRSLQKNKPIFILDGSVYDPEKLVRLDESAPLKWLEDRGIYAPPYLSEIITFIQENYSFVKEVNTVPVYKLNN